MMIHQQGASHQNFATSTYKAVTEDCITLFDKLRTATHHISMAMVNLSSLAKQVDVQTFRIILRASACPLVQININEGMLDSTKDKLTKSSKEHCEKKLRKAILPDETNAKFHKEPVNSAIHLLTAVVYLRLKKHLFNKGTQIEAATKFNVKNKALGQICQESVTGVERTGRWHKIERTYLPSHRRSESPNQKERGKELSLAVMKIEKQVKNDIYSG